jgi:hypothetical protein
MGSQWMDRRLEARGVWPEAISSLAYMRTVFFVLCPAIVLIFLSGLWPLLLNTIFGVRDPLHR